MTYITKKIVSCPSFLKPWLNAPLQLDINRKVALYRDYKRGLIELNADRADRLYRNLPSDRLRKAKSNYSKAKFSSKSTDSNKKL